LQAFSISAGIPRPRPGSFFRNLAVFIKKFNKKILLGRKGIHLTQKAGLFIIKKIERVGLGKEFL